MQALTHNITKGNNELMVLIIIYTLTELDPSGKNDGRVCRTVFEGE